ncbi:mitogen-activated protein kinase kinase kinase 18-like [Pyrus x bretschneideri]|uniref:mitogen-activated protein kinase kinase kinase 18-like n=1 Tax=Pyrus x bretschneideri TaxID=225117 RepID=UPI00202E36E4|nr:mitogen-activated protein kinase kinase kinase 18-like [Pyrus x bretschneideri]
MDWTRGCTIGQGSSATVSLATSPSSGDKFAVKSAQVSQSEFLQREQKIHSVLSSPHVVSYMGHDITSENNKLMYNLLMEYVPGGTIIDAIRSRGGLVDESMIRNYTRGIVKGLDYLHSLGLVHCDIKGRNILAGEDGPKIADFGCARWANPAGASAATIGGTPMFMAPEVARGEEQGFACDIWALGCTIIEMATGGSAPWPKAADPVTVLYQIAYSKELPEIPSFLSEQATHFLEKCLRRDPTERWTASQLLKHSFLGQEEDDEVSISSSKITKQVQESTSFSPTSILDQDIWNSLGESETSGSLDQNPSFENSSDDQRIRRLSLFSGDPRWTFDDESWITVRDNDCDESNSIEDDAEGVGSEKDLDLDFLDSNNISCRINVDILEGCKKSRRNSSGVGLSNPILERDRDNLLLPSISSFW